MIKYCLQQWNANKNKLQEKFENQKGWNRRNYENLVVEVVKTILNIGSEFTWDSDHITEIDDGDYQGTLLYLIPRDTYQPSEYEYLITYVNYGSCSFCDVLQSIQSGHYNDDYLTETQVKDFMTLCKDILTNMKMPYNYGWRHKDMFDEVK